MEYCIHCHKLILDTTKPQFSLLRLDSHNQPTKWMLFPRFCQWSKITFIRSTHNLPMHTKLSQIYFPLNQSFGLNSLKITKKNGRLFDCSILAFSTNFCPIENDLSGNTAWPPATGFQKLAKLSHFGIFNELLSIWNVNVARFARKVDETFSVIF